LKKLKIAVLGSTKGTDLQAVIDAIEKKELDAEIVLVASNKQDAFILERAKKHKLETLFLDPKKFSSREEFDKELAKKIREKKADLVVLIGYMKILSRAFCHEFAWKILNIHPALLPMFAGEMDTDVHQKVKDMGLRETGCTLHFVTEKVDEGPVIMQKKVPVYPNDTPETIKAKVQKAEQEVLVKALKLFSREKIVVENGQVKILE